MIIATITTYNDMPLIKDCIESVIDKVDNIIAVDGKYRDFPGLNWESTDGTLEYLDGLNIDVISSLNADEVGKRNSYLDKLPEGNICLNIDADEVLITDLPKLTADIGIIHIGENGDRRRHRRSNRFFRYRKGLHYWGTHKMILDSQDKLFANLQRVGENYTSEDTKVEFLHNNHLRCEDRKLNKRTYYQILMKREAKINEPAK